jgi:hypothetical protein
VQESALYASFFALLSPIQLGWGFLVCTRRTRHLLFVGALLSVLVALLWVMSRTTGLPLGPEPWHPEEIGALDVTATVDELTLALLLLTQGFMGRRTGSHAIVFALKTLGVISIVLSALTLLGGHHT